MSEAVTAQTGSASRLLIVDPGLRDGTGHHLQLVEAVTAEARRRGRRLAVIGHREMVPSLRERRFMPHFRAWTYDVLAEDPVAGWLETHMVQTGTLVEDLERLPIEADDILFWPSASAAHVQAAAAWGAGRPNRLILVPAYAVGLDRDNGVVGAEAVTWRYAFRALRATVPAAEVGSWFHRLDQHRHIARPIVVGRLPCPQEGRPRDRRTDDPVLVGVIGHQRPEKGLALLPEIVARLEGRARFLVQDSGNEACEPVWAALERAGCEILRRPLDGPDWRALLDRLSLLLLPYRPEAYAAQPSGIACEALAAALPMVVPAGTEPAEQGRCYGAGVTTFADWEPESIARALEAAVQTLPYQARLSLDAAARWRAGNGPAALFDALGL